MWRCNECRERFSEPYIRYEDHGLFREPWTECPECGSSDIEEVWGYDDEDEEEEDEEDD